MASFFLAADNRLKTGWRVGFFFIAQILWQLLIVIAVFTGIRKLMGGSLDILTAYFGYLTIPITWVALVSIYPLLLVFRRFIDKKSFGSLGLAITKQTFLHISAGILLGLLSISAAVFILYVTGSCEIKEFAWHNSSVQAVLRTVLILLLTMVLVGFTEELIMRGYIMGNLLETMKPLYALLISSFLFMIMHALNPEMDPISVINLFLAGILLGLAFSRTKSLWLPIGLHFGWNFAQTGLYSFPISGKLFQGLINTTFVGPKLLTGGEFGLEGGILGTLMILVLILTILWWKKLAPINL